MKKLTYRDTINSCCLCYITQAMVNNLLPLMFIIFQRSFGISYEMLGRLIFINFITQLIVDWLALKYVDRIGYRKSVVSGLLFSAAGFFAIGILPNVLPSAYFGLSLGMICCAVGGGIIEVIVSPLVDCIPGDAKASKMTFLHSFYCWGQVGVVIVVTILLKLLGEVNWYVIPLLCTLFPLYCIFKFYRVPIVQPSVDEETGSVKGLFKNKIFLIFLILMTCSGASELTMSQWSSLFAQQSLGLSKVAGDILGPCLFGIMMGIGRTVHGIYGERFSIRKFLIGSSVFCVACYITAAVSKNAVLSLLGCAFCGLSISLMWPGTLSLASKNIPNGGTAMFGLLALFGDLGCSVGPWISGMVSDIAMTSSKISEISAATGSGLEQLSVKTGLLFGTFFPVLMLICLALKRKKKK